MNLTAQDLAEIRAMIEEEGMECVWREAEGALVDANKPWLGSDTANIDTPVWIAFVNVATAAAMLTQWKDKVELSSKSLFGLMGGYGVEPSIGDLVLRPSGETIVVKDIASAAPAGEVLFYILEFQA